MKDSVIAGNGNSRKLKSSLDAGTSWPAALEMLRVGTFPIDLFGVNPSGFEQMGTPLNTENMLPDTLAARLGLTNTATLAQFLDALTTLANGAVKKSGDTMTGRLVTPEFRVNASAGDPNVTLYRSSKPKTTLSHQSAYNRTIIVSYDSGSEHYEVYTLPVPDENLDSNPYYVILTSKNPVTVAQGGTGAANVHDALTNLNIRTGVVTIPSIPANSDVSVSVTFDEAMPANTYSVTVSSHSAGADAKYLSCSTGSRAVTGFQISVSNAKSADITNAQFMWQVIGS